jgi:hypothetical protein
LPHADLMPKRGSTATGAGKTGDKELDTAEKNGLL